MRGTIEKVTALNRELVIYLPPDYNKTQKSYPVLYSHDGAEMEKLASKLMRSIEEGFEKGELNEFIGIGIYTTPEKRQDYLPFIQLM